jgi:hypothetical protein
MIGAALLLDTTLLLLWKVERDQQAPDGVGARGKAAGERPPEEGGSVPRARTGLAAQRVGTEERNQAVVGDRAGGDCVQAPDDPPTDASASCRRWPDKQTLFRDICSRSIAFDVTSL